VCKFGGDPAICLREEAICAKVYRRTDRRTDDGSRAIALAHSWNELKKTTKIGLASQTRIFCVSANGKTSLANYTSVLDSKLLIMSIM